MNKGPIGTVAWQSSVADWNIVCGDHELLLDPVCRISKGALVYTIQALPAEYRTSSFATESLKVGTHHKPGSIVFIRSGDQVADGFEPSVYSDQAKPVLMAGGEVLARWTEWPNISQTQTIQVDGFVDAYSIAMENIKRMAGD